MLKTISEILCFCVFTVLNFYILKKLFNSTQPFFNIKTIFLLFLLLIVSFSVYTTSYLIHPIVIRTIAGIIIYKIIFDETLSKTILSYLTVMTITFFADIIISYIIVHFITINEMRTQWYILLASNLSTASIVYFIFKIDNVLTIIKKFLLSSKEETTMSLIVFYSLIFIVIISLLFSAITTYNLNNRFLINIIIITIFIVILIFYIYDKDKYYRLHSQYDSLFNYVQQFENSIDNMNLNNHEYKNQLAVLKSYIEDSDKENALNIILDMNSDFQSQDTSAIEPLKNIPKGGIKGLVYYKIIISNNKKLNICIDVSKNAKEKLSKLSKSQIKNLCSLIGIYFDNAIDASENSREKLLGFEIYAIDNKLIFTISNTYNDKVLEFDKINSNGYTTKGKGHGRGLYLAKKIVKQNEWVMAESNIRNNMYIQQIKIEI